MVIRSNKVGSMMTTIAVGSTFNKIVPMLKMAGKRSKARITISNPVANSPQKLGLTVAM